MIFSVLNIIPNLPNLPSEIIESMNKFLDLIFGSVELLGIFVPVILIKAAVPIVILIINFDKVYKAILWVLKKIPVFGVKE